MKTRRELWDELREDLRRRGDLESSSTRDLITVAVWLAGVVAGGFLTAWAVLG